MLVAASTLHCVSSAQMGTGAPEKNTSVDAAIVQLVIGAAPLLVPCDSFRIMISK